MKSGMGCDYSDEKQFEALAGDEWDVLLWDPCSEV